MPNELEVDASGLRMAAAGSSDLAADLVAGAAVETASGARPTTAAVSVLDAAVNAVRRRQSSRIAVQAEGLRLGGTRYDETDGGAAEIITVTV